MTYAKTGQGRQRGTPVTPPTTATAPGTLATAPGTLETVPQL